MGGSKTRASLENAMVTAKEQMECECRRIDTRAPAAVQGHISKLS
jgi:hypothetical protein